MANFWALIKAITGITQIIIKATEAWNNYQDKKIEKHYNNKARVKSKLTKQIEGASTDEERKELVKRLSNLVNS